MADNKDILAFPGAYDNRKYQHTGMTLRDYFAGQALGSLVISSNGKAINSDVTAQQAYQVADAMLAAREKPNG